MSETVAQSNLAALEDQKDCDVVFVVGDWAAKERILCHQFPLRTRSPVFEVMFADRWKPNKDVSIPDVEPYIFRQFLQFMYGDKFTTKIDEAISLLYVADKYQVTSLIEQCEMLMKAGIKLDSAIQIYEAARKFGLTSLEKQAGDLMAKKFAKLIDHPSFKMIDEDTLLQLIPRNDLQVDELKLFEALLRWTSFKLGTRSTLTNQRKVLRRVLRLVRFPLMKEEDFSRKVTPTSILTKNESFAVLTYIQSTEMSRHALKDKLGFPWHPRQKMGSEYTVNFYEEKRTGFHPLFPHNFISSLDHTDANRFSFHWNRHLRSNGTASITSIVLRGPNYSSLVKQNSGLSWISTSTWTVSLKLGKITNPSSGTAELEGVREVGSFEIFANKNTNVAIRPPFVLQTDCDYLIQVSYSSAVYVLNPKYFVSTSRQDFITSTMLKANSFWPVNDEGVSEQSCFFENHYSSFSGNYNKDYGYNSMHKSHCIRSVELIVS